MDKLSPFHLAIPVNDIANCRKFYKEVLGCTEGRSADTWIDFNFFGHQLVVHKKHEENDVSHKISNSVDGHNVPVPHFGVVLDWEKWEILAGELKKKGVQFIIEPYVRFVGEVGEQATMFFSDPENNSLEFKAFKNMDQLFAS